MKCDLCGGNSAQVRTENDYIHAQMTSRQIVWCPDCGYRRALHDCHTEQSLLKEDKTARQYADEKKAAYQKIVRNNAPPAKNTPAPRAYVQGNQPGQPPKAKAKANNNSKGCLTIAIVVIVILFAIFSKLME